MTWSQRGKRWAALLLLTGLPGMPAYGRTHRGGSHHSESWGRDHFAAAERMREALNGRPPADRKRSDYQRVINAYRSVYYGAPTSTKADPSVVAVAETMVEMGRRFDDDKILKSAIGQYKFLRREYPGSKYRCDALFTIGEIYSDDLNDPEQARATFKEFLRRYPHNRLIDDAQQAIAALDRQAEAERKAEADKQTAPETPGKGRDQKDASAGKAGESPAEAEPAALQQPSARRSGRLPRVTGIRHWSTPDYTRVAIDLESEVKFGSQRIANPDRIFFDLRDTKLASTLVGKGFDVDDGFLRKIRVAQFQPGRTRVVLEVDDLSDYDAFLLPDPYRLIIDIHGKGRNAAAQTGNDAPSETDAASAVATTAQSKSKVEALRAEAGKAPVTTEDAGDDVKVTPRTGPQSSKPTRETQKLAAVKGEVSAVKKVVVEADDDPPAVETAKVEPPQERATAPSRKDSDDHATNVDSPADDKQSGDKPQNHRPAGTRSHPKSAKPSKTLEAAESSENIIREASPTARGDRSLIRALGLKIGKIVIDPGHGGHDTGTIGPEGLEEKDLVLEVGRKLGKLLESRLGAEVVYTRKNDTFIPLETRTAIANQQRADLFISIHANSSHDPAARGVETYYLNFTSSPEALEVAARENAVSEKSIYELQDLVKKIALKEKIEESREFAGDVQESLHNGLAAKSPGIRNRGVKKAPFIVLIGANMPSILAEISFVSNPGDEHRLETIEYRQRIAESLYKGIAKYVNGLSGVKVASKIEKVSAQ